MKNISVICDRCGKIIEGTLDVCPTTGVVITGGYYNVSEGNWKEFKRWEEEIVCDNCMHSDPKYKQIYNLE